jgi:hypothetical protein
MIASLFSILIQTHSITPNLLPNADPQPMDFHQFLGRKKVTLDFQSASLLENSVTIPITIMARIKIQFGLLIKLKDMAKFK